MTTNYSLGPTRVRRRDWLIGVVALAVVGALVAWFLLFDRFAHLTLDDVVASESPSGGVTNSREITGEVCGARIPCVEAYSTDQADYYRFSDRDTAAAFATELADGFVVHYIVMDFAGKDSASRQEQRWAMEGLAGAWQDYEGPFPDR